jgi:hypothetical protein
VTDQSAAEKPDPRPADGKPPADAAGAVPGAGADAAGVSVAGDPPAPDPRIESRTGPEDVAPHLHADADRPGTPPADVDPGAAVPAPGTSEELEPVRGLHVPDLDEDGRIAPGRYRTEGPGTEAVQSATDDAPRP